MVLPQRGHVDYKSGLGIASEYPFIGGIDLLNGDELDVRLDLMLCAEAGLFLHFFDG